MLIKRTVLLFALILSCLTVIKGQNEKKKFLVKLGTSGLTVNEVRSNDSVLYYILKLEIVKSFGYSEIPNYSWLSFYSKEDVVKWFDEAIEAP